jgi:LmbE family N-acetylglucosaminyl deacetylase
MNDLKADVLVIMPHPDDAEFGCAGTVARWVKQGKRVVYILLTNGDKGTSDRALTLKNSLRYGRRTARGSAGLGVSEVVYLDIPIRGWRIQRNCERYRAPDPPLSP